MSEPPEEPHLRSEPNILSPASPKPIHFPAPSNIPILEMQMDIGFNQTEAHMNDPAMHNTEVRPDFWRDPSELNVPADHASPYSTGGEAVVNNAEAPVASEDERTLEATVELTDSGDAAAKEDAQTHIPAISNAHANAPFETETDPVENIQASSDPSVPAADFTAVSQASLAPQTDTFNQGDYSAVVQPSNSNVDVQALLDTLQTAPAPNASALFTANAVPQADDPNVAGTLSPTSQLQSQHAQFNLTPLPPGAESDSSPLSVPGLGVPPTGLPPRPPPQEQPLIHPNYVHSQHIRDYHPHATNPAFQPHGRSGSQGNVADVNSKNYVPPVHSPSGANDVQSAASRMPYNANSAMSGNLYVSNGQQSPTTAATHAYTPTLGHTAAFSASPQNLYGAQYPSQTNTPTDSRRDRGFREGEQPRPEDRPWDAEVQRKYDRFIEDERRYVSEGRWEQFPQGSRLFVGKSTGFF